MVIANTLVATNDTIPSTGGSVLANDTLNGQPVTTANTDVTPATNGPLSIDANGTVTVAPNTPSGTYTISYQICETGANPTNCKTATASVVIVNTLVANDDNFTSKPVNGYVGGNVGNIFQNNGNNEDSIGTVMVSATTVNITISNNGGIAGLVITSAGDIIVPAGIASGTYYVDYIICDKVNATNCDTARVTIVVVVPPIVAVTDDYKTPINSATGGILTNVMSNDLLNGQLVKASEVNIVLVNSAANPYDYTIDANGNLKIPVGVPAGSYQLEYQICEKLNPTNCTTAMVLFIVLDPCDFDDSPSSCDVIVHNAFSPNGDDINKVFTIEGIEKYSDNVVEIYNRWGVLVYEQKGYNNTDKSFNGFSEGRITINNSLLLPDGTYYYFISYVKNSGLLRKTSGYLYIKQ